MTRADRLINMMTTSGENNECIPLYRGYDAIELKKYLDYFNPTNLPEKEIAKIKLHITALVSFVMTIFHQKINDCNVRGTDGSEIAWLNCLTCGTQIFDKEKFSKNPPNYGQNTRHCSSCALAMYYIKKELRQYCEKLEICYLDIYQVVIEKPMDDYINSLLSGFSKERIISQKWSLI